MMRYTVLATAFCILGLQSIVPARADHTESQRVKRMSEAWPVGDFTLVDQYGKAFTGKQMLARWSFIVLGNSHCAEPCKTALSALTGMFQRIAGTKPIETTQVLFVSLDPERDSPASLQRYLAPFDKRFVGVTGSWQTLKQLAADLGVSARLPTSPGIANASDNKYNGSLLLMGPDGTVLSEFLPPFDVSLFTAEDLKTRVRGVRD
jgi:protein SCO1/2